MNSSCLLRIWLGSLIFRGVVVMTALLLAEPAWSACVPGSDPEKGTRDGSPLEDLPAHIELVHPLGIRPDWSPDGRSLAFLDSANDGDVWIIDLATRATRNLTGKFSNHQGFARAHFLKTGDLLLCGPTSGPRPTPVRPEAGRFTGVLWVFRAPFKSPPRPLGMWCWEGIAISKQGMKIAWNRSDIDFTDPDQFERVVFGISEIWTGRVALKRRKPPADLVKVRMAIDRSRVHPLAVLEVQDFRPRSSELIFTNYVHLPDGAEVMSVDLKSGAVRNYSRSPCYEEAEGIFPDGRSTLVERDLESSLEPTALDIWRLSLDELARYQRLTHFNRYHGFYASNPVVHPSGAKFAFQLSVEGGVQGDGGGLLVFDLERFESLPR
jgi:hypothetical protein